MKRINKRKTEAKKEIVAIAIVIFLLMLANAGSQEIEKYENLKKENVSKETDAALKEYYSTILGASTQDAKFNTISTKDEIAIVNVTVDGKDRRILSRVTRAVGLPKAEAVLGQLIRASNITVFENLWILGREVFSIDTSFGARDFFSIKSGSERLFEEGRSRLADGIANVSINPVLAESIESYNVYLSPEGLTKGIYISEKSGSYFIVKGLNKKSNIAFSWMLSGAKRANLTEEREKLILVTIDREEGLSEIKISGFQFGKSNFSNLLTGNVVLEEDLSAILDESESDNEVNQTINESNNLPQENAVSGNESVSDNESSSQNISVLKFTVYSANEEYIIDQIASVAGFGKPEVKKFARFVYKDPVKFEDEALEESAAEPAVSFPKGIGYANGSLIIRLGES